MFKGVGTALITPFNEDFTIDYESLRKIVNFQINGGVDSLIVLGTTGESPVFDYEERSRIIKAVIEENKGRIPVIVGTGTNNPAKVIQYNQQAKELGADGLLIVNPYYNKSTQSGLVEYFKYITVDNSLPIIIYNVPSRTGMNMMPDTEIKIHKACPNVVGVKEACGSISQVAQLIAMKPENLSVLSGNDDQILPIMALGGDGVISVVSNILPREVRNLTHALLEKDIDKARKLNNTYLGISNLLFVETSPSPVKYAASILGLCKNVVRMPLIPASANTEKLIRDELEKLGIQ